MALSIKDDQTDALVRKLAKARNLSFTAAIRLAVDNQLRRDTQVPDTDWERRLADIAEIQKRSKKLILVDNRTDDEILGFDGDGLPK